MPMITNERNVLPSEMCAMIRREFDDDAQGSVRILQLPREGDHVIIQGEPCIVTKCHVRMTPFPTVNIIAVPQYEKRDQ